MSVYQQAKMLAGQFALVLELSENIPHGRIVINTTNSTVIINPVHAVVNDPACRV